MAEASWLAPRGDGVELLIHVRPGARRSEVVGVHGTALAVRVAARPVGGAANEALRRLLAEALAVPLRAITLVAGAQGRTKRVHVAGLDAAAAHARFAPHLN
ncbi:MAG TPA: DUF167 domain-containing protein [Candidatus Limnocylindria bacterium]|nr:DUF167 domain-containing protein [Candidatus Limnocylindria bacterium]